MDDYIWSGDNARFKTIAAAKKYIESLPYYAEAISKDGMLQTIFYDCGTPAIQRQAVVSGIGANRTVTMSRWYLV